MYGLENINFGAIERHEMQPSLEQEAADAIRLAKRGTMAIVALQAIAALSALGIFIIAAKQYQRGSRKQGRTSKGRRK